MRCRGLHRLANPPYLKGFPFSTLLRVAPYCVPGGIRVVSKGPSVSGDSGPKGLELLAAPARCFAASLGGELLARVPTWCREHDEQEVRAARHTHGRVPCSGSS